MKQLSRLLIPILLILTACNSNPNELIIKGTLESAPESMSVYFVHYEADSLIYDSTMAVNGKFEIKISLTEPRRFYITTPLSRKIRQSLELYAEPATIRISGKADSIENASISGSSIHQEYAVYLDQFKTFDKRENDIYEAYDMLEEGDKEGEKELDSLYNLLSMERNAIIENYISTHPKSFVSLTALGRLSGGIIEIDFIEPIFNSLDESVKTSLAGKSFYSQIETAKKTMPGNMAMDFTQNDTLGNPISLSSFKGKYVLIDFWASWCGPCRVENPNLVKAYSIYKNKGFEILGVSLDHTHSDWMDAIHKDKLTWAQVSDLKAWRNGVAKMYGVRSIPQNFLVDSEGKIIARDLRGNTLEEKLKELL